MNDQRLLAKREQYRQLKPSLHEQALEKYEKAAEIEYTHNSTAIEGNTLTLIETKVLLEDGISIGGKNMRELYEVVNHDKAVQYAKTRIAKGQALDENAVKDIHAILMENILAGGFYRDQNVYISGAGHTPPSPGEMYRQVKEFYADMPFKKQTLNAIEFAAWTHAEFVRIHPFLDGNGRTSRLLMNYQLMADGFLFVDIRKENRIEYYNALEKYAMEGDLAPFAEMIAQLEEQKLDSFIKMAQPDEEPEQGHEMQPTM